MSKTFFEVNKYINFIIFLIIIFGVLNYKQINSTIIYIKSNTLNVIYSPSFLLDFFKKK